MFGSAMMDIAVGTVFVFMAASLAVTAANELLASLLRFRALHLEEGLRRLLDADKSGKGQAIFGDLHKHTLIQSLVRREGHWPSYLPARTFALVLLDLAKLDKGDAELDEIRTKLAASALPDRVKDTLRLLLVEAEADLKKGKSAYDKLREGVEGWFNDAMDRVGGWYKRKIQYLNFAVAFAIVGATNLDSIDLVRSLSRDATMRQALAAEAVVSVERSLKSPHDEGDPGRRPPPAAAADAPSAKPAEAPPARPADAAGQPPERPRRADLSAELKTLDGLGVPIGWSREGSLPSPFHGAGSTLFWLRKLLGLMLTTLAASLGAPFWFDVLSKFISIRSAGKAPPKISASKASDPA
ncbi:MAG: hypothetical protein U0359_40030 [Byssovorax sp.]